MQLLFLELLFFLGFRLLSHLDQFLVSLLAWTLEDGAGVGGGGEPGLDGRPQPQQLPLGRHCDNGRSVPAAFAFQVKGDEYQSSPIIVCALYTPRTNQKVIDAEGMRGRSEAIPMDSR